MVLCPAFLPYYLTALVKVKKLKSISNVTQSIIAPWYPWKGVGGGTQYLLPESLITLKNMGFLKF